MCIITRSFDMIILWKLCPFIKNAYPVISSVCSIANFFLWSLAWPSLLLINFKVITSVIIWYYCRFGGVKELFCLALSISLSLALLSLSLSLVAYFNQTLHKAARLVKCFQHTNERERETILVKNKTSLFLLYILTL